MTAALAPRVGVRYDFRLAPDDPAPTARYAAAIEQCRWLDVRGIDHIQLSEHHGADDGYCPSPVVVAAAIAAATRRARILLAALVPALHDPIRLAEDLAVVDLVSCGRLDVGLVAGYREDEFEMFGVPYDARFSRLEETVGVLEQAWSGEAFTFRGRRVRVRPRPVQRPRPPLYLGGRTVAAARRAARLADGMLCASPAPEVETAYRAERERTGKGLGAFFRPGGATSVFVTEDPDEAWKMVGPCALRETNSYAAWAAGRDVNSFREVASVDELRARSTYRVVTPSECVALYQSLGPQERLVLHPLLGGLDPELGWQCVELFGTRVLPVVATGACHE